MLTVIRRMGLRAVIMGLIMLLGLAMGFTTGVVHGPAEAKSQQGPVVTGTLPPVAANPVAMQAMPAVNRAAIAAQLVGVNCALVVPADPFSSIGLATPWQLVSGQVNCTEANPNTAVFLQATAFDPATKQFFVYPPLVIDAGTLPIVAPLVPALPAGAVVGIWGGSNGGAVKLVGPGVASCTNGTTSPFGQVFFCDTQAFFAAVNAAGVTIPPLGTGNDGQPCPTIRSFTVVDQDQSDNVQTTYLVDATGRTAQDTATNRVQLDQNGLTKVKNPSDNRVLALMDKALDCTPLLAPDIADGGNMVPSQGLDELQAAMEQAQPQALIPEADPMVLTGGLPDLAKLNAYRESLDMPLATTLADASTAVYCVNILNQAPAKLLLDKEQFTAAQSPVPMQGDSLYTFLASRLMVTLGPAPAGLGCTTLLGITNPVTVTLDGNGVAIFASIYGK